MTHVDVLFVCAANVCRSPMAELTFRRELGSDADLVIASAGMRATSSDTICSLVATVHDEEQEWSAQAAAHRATRGTPGLIGRSRLILVASRDIRGEVVRAAPRSRDHVFTLREAARLGSGFAPSGDDIVGAYVAHLNRARSRAAPASSQARSGPKLFSFLPGRKVEDPISIADRHGSRGHRQTVIEVDRAVSEIARQLGPSIPRS